MAGPYDKQQCSAMQSLSHALVSLPIGCYSWQQVLIKGVCMGQQVVGMAAGSTLMRHGRRDHWTHAGTACLPAYMFSWTLK
jgi:hypothetical protein